MKTRILRDIEERFWGKVNIRGENDCWLWTASVLGSMGYGAFSVGRKIENKIVFAHRVAWVLTNGTIPTGMKVCHHCDTPKCCNPKHLFLGDQFDNMRDCSLKRRQARKLEEEEVLEIRRRHSVGEKKETLAKEFGCSKQNIGYVVRNVTWRHLL